MEDCRVSHAWGREFEHQRFVSLVHGVVEGGNGPLDSFAVGGTDVSSDDRPETSLRTSAVDVIVPGSGPGKFCWPMASAGAMLELDDHTTAFGSHASP